MGRCAQLRGLFRFTAKEGLPLLKDKCVLGRWAELLPKSQWDISGQPLLRCATPPADIALPNMPNKWFEFIAADAILESICVLPRPHEVNGSVFNDKGSIHDDNRYMWAHTVGKSSQGEV